MTPRAGCALLLRARWGNNGGKQWKGGRNPSHSINFITAHDGAPPRPACRRPLAAPAPTPCCCPCAAPSCCCARSWVESISAGRAPSTLTPPAAPASPARRACLSRRLHAGGPGVLQREAQQRQWREQQGWGDPQPELELRRRGADRQRGCAALACPGGEQGSWGWRSLPVEAACLWGLPARIHAGWGPGEPGAAALAAKVGPLTARLSPARRGQPPAPAPDAQLFVRAAAEPRRAHAAHGRRVRPQQAGQQQHLLPRQRGQLDRLAAGARRAKGRHGLPAATSAGTASPAGALQPWRRARRSIPLA